MAEKNTVQVVVDGKIIQLTGAESESYMYEVAGYLNNKISDFKREFKYYNKLDDQLKSLLLEINICDDLFNEQEKTRQALLEKEEQEREVYQARHELVNMQIKLENALKQLSDTQARLLEYERQEKKD